MPRKPFAALLLLLLAVFSLSAPVSAQDAAAQEALRQLLLAPLDTAYEAGVLNAKANLLHMQSPPAAPDIWDLSADNPKLVWSGQPGSSQVLMVSFTRASFYSGAASGQTLPAGADLWVTPAPQVQAGVKAEAPGGVVANPKLAVSQFLGLPYTNGNDSMVSLWVNPGNMLRPAIDPRIDTHGLETSFPLTLQTVPLTPAPVLPRQSPAPGFGPATDYAAWFAERESVIYNSSIPGGPYPWTGLGYTYDWNPAAPDVVGASEFIVPKGSPVTLQSVTPVDRYF